jgi:uncharacterized metal-binding protein YceD (DUF177 family)
LGSTSVTETLQAGPAERAALALRFGIVDLEQLSATLNLERILGGLIRVVGRLEADVVQNCVITLIDFPTHIEDSFTVDFAGTEMPIGPGAEITVDVDYDPPEPVEGGVIDMGELVAQYLSLALDPYPRSPGAAIDPVWADSDAAERSPFAILKNLKTPN